MPKIKIDGFICETKFSPTDKPVYHFYDMEMKTQYTCPIMPYSIELDLPDADTTAAHVEAIDEKINETYLKHTEELEILLRHKEKWLALDFELRENSDYAPDNGPTFKAEPDPSADGRRFHDLPF